MKNIRFIVVMLLAIGMNFGITSCKKEEPTVASIKVVNTSGDAISGAFVRLFGTSTTTPSRTNILDDTIYTNAAGIANFDYTDYFELGQAGFAVLDIDVTYETFTGTGTLKIEAEKTNNETVILQ
jgi:hypothetical protein